MHARIIFVHPVVFHLYDLGLCQVTIVIVIPPRLVPKRRSEHMGGNRLLGSVVVDHSASKGRQFLSHKMEQCMEAKEGITVMLIGSMNVDV